MGGSCSRSCGRLGGWWVLWEGLVRVLVAGLGLVGGSCESFCGRLGGWVKALLRGRRPTMRRAAMAGGRQSNGRRPTNKYFFY